MRLTTEIILCRTAAIQDTGTRHALRDLIIPSLTKEADELEACRRQCEAREDWLADWIDAGMLTEEVTIRQAIATAEKRLADIDVPKRWIVTVSFEEQGVSPIITEANGTPDSIRAYYMQDGGRLNVGQFGHDKMAHVSHVALSS